ncbi:hypothetical protein GCM10011494_13070 [Novosphingobium endophyticum]|uniref:Uncharacterized protein n=1 Tax=Novosphingobium endophyticum TaxID=1955250 RepID=A0A916TRD9_9SPHN|nr:hypothetical protein [Novosphingobium endophyticum]GGB95988.1 hypothetical protein GCM10011494_13070 [Novosphingobium endophyticum]
MEISNTGAEVKVFFVLGNPSPARSDAAMAGMEPGVVCGCLLSPAVPAISVHGSTQEVYRPAARMQTLQGA